MAKLKSDHKLGDKTRAIIGVVVNAGETGINAKTLCEKLNEWGYPTNFNTLTIRLCQLVKQGKIGRLYPGVYISTEFGW